MKKIFYSSIAVLFAAAVATSCAKEANVPQTQDENLVAVTLIAGNPEAEPATKTEMVGATPKWSVGDKIGVSDGLSSNASFSTAITEPSASASFSGNVEVGSYYAYYPYSSSGVGEVPANSGNFGAKVDLPANQNPTATSFDGKADLMLSKPFDVTVENPTIDDLQFARLGAVVKVVLVDSESIMSDQHPSTVSMTASTDLAGRVLVNMKDQCLGAIYYNASKKVTANYTSVTKYEIDGTNATYFIVVPQTLEAGSTLTIEASTENYSIEKEITIPAGGIKLPAGKVTTLQVNLTGSHIKASAGAALPFSDDMEWANNGASDDGADISSSIEEKSSGLYVSASKVYKGKGGLKLGTGSAIGSITTKELDLSGAFYIAIQSGKYGSDTGTLIVMVDEDEVINEAFGATSFVNIDAGTYTNKSKVTIKTSTRRGYLYDVQIQSGTYVAPPMINVTSDNPMDVSNANDLYAIEYTIINPVDGKSISAATDVDWITDFDYSTDGEISFEVAAQAAGNPARSGNITLLYDGADDVVVAVNQAAGAGAVVDYTIDFESASISSAWTVTNFLTHQTGSITAHGGTYYGTTGGKASASLVTAEKVANPSVFTCYVSKQTGNTTASSWKLEVSTDGESWTKVKEQSATSMAKGVWDEFTADLTSYSNVYVRFSYSGSTAVRNIDDLTLTTE